MLQERIYVATCFTTAELMFRVINNFFSIYRTLYYITYFLFRFTLIQTTWLENALERPSFEKITTALSQSTYVDCNMVIVKLI